MDSYFFILLVLVLIIGILLGWIIFKRKYSPDRGAKNEPSEIASIEISPGIEVFPYERFPERLELTQAFELPKETYGYIEPIFRSIPTGALIFEGSGKYILRFSPEVTQKLMEGIYHLQSSIDGIQAVARNAQGRIVEHGRLVQAGISSVAVAAMVWQVLAVITAQKFLSDINKRLANIERAINEIKEMIDLQEWSKIEGYYKYLTNNLNKLKNTSLSYVELQSLVVNIEDIIKEAEGKFFYFKKRIDTQKNSILNRELNQSSYLIPNYTLNENFDFVHQKVAEYIKHRSTSFAVYQLKIYAYYFKTCLPIVNKEACLQDIENFKIDLDKDIQEFNSEIKEINEKIGTLYGPWSFLDTALEKQKILKSELHKQSKTVQKNLKYVHQECERIEGDIKYQIEESKNPQYLEVEVKDNKISKVARLVMAK